MNATHDLKPRITSLHRDMKQFPVLLILCVLMPILLPLAALLAAVTLARRSKLLKAVGQNDMSAKFSSASGGDGPEELSIDEMICYVRDNTGWLQLPILLVLIAVIGTGMILLSA